MKKYVVLFVLLMVNGILAAQAQGTVSTQRLLGYTQTDSITVSGAAFGVVGTYPVGAVLTPQMLSSYAGCRVQGIRVAAAMNLGRARTFIYTIANGAITPVIEQRQRLYEGWNTVYFNGEGYEIAGNETLFFGFDYTETEEMVAAEQGGLCGYGEENVDGSFYCYADLGKGLGLYSLSNIGCLCVQLLVDVSSLPMYDMDMMTVDGGFKYKQAGENVDLMATMVNTGLDSICKYQLGCQLDGQQPVYYDRTDTVLSTRRETVVFTYQLPSVMSLGMHRLRVFVSEVNGQPLSESSRNDTVNVDFAIYEDTVSRSKVFMEVYTDQTSPYVPFLNSAVKRLTDEMDMLTVVNVHRPGTSLALDAAAYLHELYAYTWPTFTLNRAYFPGEAYVAYDMNDYLPVIGAEMTANIIADMVAQDYYSPAFASVGLQLSYNQATRELSVKADGNLLPEAEAIYGDLALTLMLTEDDVKSSQVQYNSVTGRTTTNKNYLHQHVLRGYLTSPIGDALKATDGKYEADYAITLDEGWDAQKMTVVALLTKKVDAVTDDNLLDVDVVNCNTASVADAIAMGVRTVGIAMPADRSACYTLDGRRVSPSSLKSGVYIQNGHKVLKK